MRIALAVAVASLTIGGISAAEEAQASIRKHTNIPAQELSSALQALARDRNLQVVFASEEVDSLRTSGAVGELTADEALTRLLSGTHLTYRYLDEKTITVQASTSARETASSTQPELRTAGSVKNTEHSRITDPSSQNSDHPPSLWSRFRLAQVDQGRAATARSAEKPGAASESTGGTQQKETTLEEVIVTGTSIRGSEKPTGSDLISLGRDAIEAVGARTTTEILASVPQMGFFNNLPVPKLTSNGLSTPVDLRGLEGGATLVLLDGHRLIGDFPLNQVANPSSIPPAAIERIEILTDGASAVYGSDAIAGVVNIITRKGFSGAGTEIRSGWGRGDYNALDMSQSIGRTWTSGSAMAVFAYSKNDPLRADELGFFTSDFRPFGGTDQRPTSCASPNIVIGGNTYVPPNYTLGTALRCEPAAVSDVYSGQSSKTLVANLRQDLSEQMSLFADVKFARLDSNSAYNPSAAVLTIPSTNPFFLAPPGVTASSETIAWDPRPVTGLTTVDALAKSGNAIVGADYSFGRWQVTASYNFGWSDSTTTTAGYDTAALSAAAAGTTADTALDPFGNGTSAGVIAAIRNNANVWDAQQELHDLNLKADGPLFAIPGGNVRFALGASYREMGYDATQTSGAIGIPPSGSVAKTRDVSAVFAEVLIPVVGGNFTLPMVHALDLSAAIRYDDYNDFGSTSNPKFGVTWSLVPGFSIRGNYATSFHAPDMADSYAVDTRVLYSASFPVTPPGRPAGPTLILAGGNTGLKPETADTYSAGFDFSPAALSGLRTSATYYDIKYKNRILSPFNVLFTTLFVDPGYAPFVILDPTDAQVQAFISGIRLDGVPTPFPSPIAQILDLRRQNLTATHTDGVDLSASYDWQAGGSTWGLNVAANKVMTFEVQGNPLASFAEDEGVPSWGVRAGLSWARGPWKADTVVSYLDSFDIFYTSAAGTSARQTVDSFTTVDLHARYAFERTGFLSGVALSLNVSNLLGEDPPVQLTAGDAGSPSGYSRKANPMGRVLWVGVQKNFDW